MKKLFNKILCYTLGHKVYTAVKCRSFIIPKNMNRQECREWIAKRRGRGFAFCNRCSTKVLIETV